MVRLPLRSLLQAMVPRLSTRRHRFAAEGHSPRYRVNGAAARDHETSSAGVERNRPLAHLAGYPTGLPLRLPITVASLGKPGLARQRAL